MFGKTKSKSVIAHSTTVKKPAPPRPPPPSKSTNIARSASMGFDPWNEQKINSGPLTRTQTIGCSYNIINRNDLIDLSSPSNSPPKATLPVTPNFPGATSDTVPDFKYHIGASIFYVKSEVKSTGSNKPTANPFSPPRPSPQSLISKTVSTKQTLPTVKRQPTIIKSSTQKTEPQNNNNYAISSHSKAAAPVLLDWDEPPKKTYAPPPTVIRPIPPPKKPGLASMRLGDRNSLTGPPPPFVPPPITQEMLSKVDLQPRYEEPPEESDDDFEDSFDNVPEPSGPPPPPPEELDDFATSDTSDQFGYTSNQDYVQDASDRAYGIALYDYASGESGDLQFAVGDVIYLTRCVDESWLTGWCGGMEGMFPANFINVVVPLEGQQSVESNYTDQSALDPNDIYTEPIHYPTHYVQALHDFQAVEPMDLTIQDGDIVTVIGQVNEDWLYGELRGQKGQFPASFLEYVPGNLPVIDPKAQ